MIGAVIPRRARRSVGAKGRPVNQTGRVRKASGGDKLQFLRVSRNEPSEWSNEEGESKWRRVIQEEGLARPGV